MEKRQVGEEEIWELPTILTENMDDWFVVLARTPGETAYKEAGTVKTMFAVLVIDPCSSALYYCLLIMWA